MLGSNQQFHRRRSICIEFVLPAILFKHHTRHLLRLDGHGSQEWVQGPELTTGTIVPTRRDKRDHGAVIRPFTSSGPKHLKFSLPKGSHSGVVEACVPAYPNVSRHV